MVIHRECQSHYSLFDEDSIIMAPTPNNNFRFELSYFYRPDSITIVPGGTSWLGTNAPNALLYGALVEAYTFMKGSPDIMQNYQQRFEAAIDRLKNVGEGKDTKDNFRSGPVRRRPINVTNTNRSNGCTSIHNK